MNNLISSLSENHHKVVNELKDKIKVVGSSTFEKGSSSKPNHFKKNFQNHKQKGFQRHFRHRKIRSVWVTKELIVSNNVNAIASWISKGTKLLETNSHGPKMIWVPKVKN